MIDQVGAPPNSAAETLSDTLTAPATLGGDTESRAGGGGRLARSSLWAFAVAACLVPLGYALYTDHIWEDFFITFRYSQNLVEGKGLVFNSGERVHGFTSPLGVLLPALCYLGTGKSSYELALWVFRILSILAFAGGGLLLLRAVKKADPQRPALLWLFAFFYLLEVKSVAYTINGMETAFVLLFLAWAVLLFVEGGPERWLARGLCWTGLMWTRPDGCVYIAAFAAAELLFGTVGWKPLFRSLAKSAGICTVLYGPWFFGAWAYYGSPIPHTVVAKSFVEQGVWGQLYRMVTAFGWLYTHAAGGAFRPIYAGDMTDWLPRETLSWFLAQLTLVAGLFCAAYWLLPVQDRLGRMASFCFALLCLYFAFLIAVFPWYLPPVTVLGLFVLSRGLLTLAEAVRRRLPDDAIYKHCPALAYAALAVFGIWHVAQFGLVSWQMRIQQEEVEMANRAQVGLWLRDHGRPNDRVYLEPVGYIGYFSGLRIVDHPGLVSPEVVRLRREKQLDMHQIIFELLPEWVVLRPFEEDMFQLPAWDKFQQQYRLTATFDNSQAIDSRSFLPGRHYVSFDAVFNIYRRKDLPGQASGNRARLGIRD